MKSTFVRDFVQPGRQVLALALLLGSGTGLAAAPETVPDAPSIGDAPGFDRVPPAEADRRVNQPLAVRPPPAPRPEAHSRRGPGSGDHVWIAGYWGWNGRDYAWTPGRWARPPRPGLVWVAPTWERRGRGYVFVEGYWIQPRVVAARPPVGPGRPGFAGGNPEVVIIFQPPPVPRAEARGRPPTNRHAWVGGYWQWTGRSYTWVAGRWELPPRGFTSWAPPQWQPRNGGFFMVGGGWR